MKKILFVFVAIAFSVTLNAKPIKIMLVTGGHAFDTLRFFQLFDSLEGIEYEHFAQPAANEALVKGVANRFDVLVFYDMWNTITEAQKQAYLKLTKEGKPFLFLHHSLASYQEWSKFEKIIGGKYVQKGPGISVQQQSTYKHDEWVYAEVVRHHPVTAGLSSIRFFDEVYGNVRISETVIPLLRTNHPQSSEFIAWENNYNNSKIVYLQSGHDSRTYESEDYRKLILQAIKYLANSNQ